MQQEDSGVTPHPLATLYESDWNNASDAAMDTQPLTQEFSGADSPPEESQTVLEGAPTNPVHSYGIHPASYTESNPAPSNVPLIPDPNIELVYTPSCVQCVQVGGGFCVFCCIDLTNE